MSSFPDPGRTDMQALEIGLVITDQYEELTVDLSLYIYLCSLHKKVNSSFSGEQIHVKRTVKMMALN